MKKLFLLFSVFFISIQSFANTELLDNKKIDNKLFINYKTFEVYKLLNELKADSVNEFSIDMIKSINNDVYDCAITIKGNFEGNTVNVVVTIHDVSWSGCQALKVVVATIIATF